MQIRPREVLENRPELPDMPDRDINCGRDAHKQDKNRGVPPRALKKHCRRLPKIKAGQRGGDDPQYSRDHVQHHEARRRHSKSAASGGDNDPKSK